MKLTHLAYFDTSRSVLLLLRALSFVIIVCFAAFLSWGADSKYLNTIYIHRLEFSHLNVAKGLYKALENNANALRKTSDPYSSGFTTSEIEVLVEYVSSEFETKPQFIISSIRKYCFGTFDSIELSNDNLYKNYEQKSYKNFTVEDCYRDNNYYFNYRMLLSSVKMTIILDYAYDGGDVDKNSSYNALMMNVNKIMKIFANTLFVAFVCQIVICCVGVGIYSLLIKHNQRGLTKNQLTSFLVHINGILSSISFIAVLIGSFSLLAISFTLKTRIKNELGSFGVFLHLGKLFFTMLWFLVVVSFVNFCCWGGIAWCTVPENYDNEEMAYRTSVQRIPIRTDSTKSNPYVDDELSADYGILSRTNTGMDSSIFQLHAFTGRMNSKRFRSNSLTTSKTWGDAAANPFEDPVEEISINSPYLPNQGERNEYLGSETEPKGLGLKPVKSNDLISVISENDTYANNMDYDQILDNKGAGSGFGLRKNGTIKNHLFERRDRFDIEDSLNTR